jgi:hypothetical protein
MSAVINVGVAGSEKNMSLGSDTTVGETSLGGVAITANALPDPYGSSSEDPWESARSSGDSRMTSSCSSPRRCSQRPCCKR